MMRVQKLENLQMCMQILKRKGVTLTGVHAEGALLAKDNTCMCICYIMEFSLVTIVYCS